MCNSLKCKNTQIWPNVIGVWIYSSAVILKVKASFKVTGTDTNSSVQNTVTHLAHKL